jgi:hypothetical protein
MRHVRHISPVPRLTKAVRKISNAAGKFCKAVHSLNRPVALLSKPVHETTEAVGKICKAVCPLNKPVHETNQAAGALNCLAQNSNKAARFFRKAAQISSNPAQLLDNAARIGIKAAILADGRRRARRQTISGSQRFRFSALESVSIGSPNPIFPRIWRIWQPVRLLIMAEAQPEISEIAARRICSVCVREPCRLPRDRTKD